MSSNPVSKTKTPLSPQPQSQPQPSMIFSAKALSSIAPPSPSPSPSPQPQPQPQPQLQPPMIFSAKALSSIAPPSPSPSPSPSPQPQPQLQPPMIFSAKAGVSQTTPSLKYGDYGLGIGSGCFTIPNSSPNPVPSFGSLTLDKKVETEKPLDKKGKSKITFQLPKSTNKQGSKSNNNKEEAKSDDDEEAEAELLSSEEDDDEESKDEGEGKKTWNLRPRRNKKDVIKKNSNGGGGRSKGASRGVRYNEGEGSRIPPPKIPTRPRTLTRPRAMNNAPINVAAAAPEKPIFSLTLTNKEIEEDFLKMTRELPPKRTSRRPKSVQNKIDEITPGMFLADVKPETYKVPDPPHRRRHR